MKKKKLKIDPGGCTSFRKSNEHLVFTDELSNFYIDKNIFQNPHFFRPHALNSKKKK